MATTLAVRSGVVMDEHGDLMKEVWELLCIVNKREDLLGRMYVTSAFRDGDWNPSSGSFHGALDDKGAMDVGASYSGFTNNQSTRDMRDACELLKPYFNYFVQVIHSTPFDTDDGYYIYMGQRHNYGRASDPNSTAGEHRDHIHTAAAVGNLRTIIGLLKAKLPAPPPVVTPPVVTPPVVTPPASSAPTEGAAVAGYRDYGNYGVPPFFVSDRPDSVLLADNWAQEHFGKSPYDSNLSFRTKQLQRIEEKLDSLLAAAARIEAKLNSSTS